MNPLKKYIWIVDTLMKKGEKGIQIVRYSDGTSRKVLIK